MTLFAKIVLGAAGIIAVAIGLALTFTPHGFYTGYGRDIGTDPIRLSELRAAGANLAGLGAVIAVGAALPALTRLSAALGTLVFWAFALGRGISLMLDGWPGNSIASAFVIELTLGALCLIVWCGTDQQPAPYRQAKTEIA